MKALIPIFQWTCQSISLFTIWLIYIHYSLKCISKWHWTNSFFYRLCTYSIFNRCLSIFCRHRMFIMFLSIFLIKFAYVKVIFLYLRSQLNKYTDYNMQVISFIYFFWFIRNYRHLLLQFTIINKFIILYNVICYEDFAYLLISFRQM